MSLAAMSELDLMLTREFDAETIRSELGKYLRVKKPTILFLKSAEPPIILRLLGDVPAWLPLTAAAGVYLSTLAKRAADATWGRLASRFSNDQVRPLIHTVRTLEKAANSVGGNVTLLVGLNIPDEDDGTVLSIGPGDPKEMERMLATFVVRAKQISKAMQAEVESGRQPFGGARIELQDNGSLLISWVTADFHHHELMIPK